MKTKLHLLFLTCLITLSGFAQSSEKVKGSRNVTTQVTEIEAFNRLVIGNDFKINLKQGVLPNVEISTDDNLHELIDFNVQEGSLSFRTNKVIRSSKKMEITVTFRDSLNIIELKEDAELTSLSTLKLKDLIVRTKESSEAYLTVEAETFGYIAAGKTKAELNITAQEITVDLSDNSDIKALLNADKIEIDMLQRADARIEGDTKELIIKMDNSTVLKAEKLTAKLCNLITEGRADAHIEASKDLILEASGATETYIYGNAKIELNKFEDDAILRKK
ncbi:GIN domain-containing protein [Lacinutrix chionoecetis]